MRALGDSIRPHLIVSELRTAAADELWLSPAYRRDVVIIHFTWYNHPDEVDELLPRIEAALAPFDARPHWGKVHRFDRRPSSACTRGSPTRARCSSASTRRAGS